MVELADTGDLKAVSQLEFPTYWDDLFNRGVIWGAVISFPVGVTSTPLLRLSDFSNGVEYDVNSTSLVKNQNC